MFFLNLGYHTKLRGSPHGLVYTAAGMNREQFERRARPTGDFDVLFDPQLYLSGLDRSLYRGTCLRLSTYPWFGWDNCPDYLSKDMNLREWETDLDTKSPWPIALPSDPERIRSLVHQSFQFQANVCGATRLITPVPLAQNPADQFSTQLDWIKAGLDLQQEFDTPVLASIPALDELLVYEDPGSNTYLQTILDNLTVEESLHGVYIAIAQNRSTSSVRLRRQNVVKAVMTLCYVIGELSNKEVILNFVDDLGLVCLALGASSFASGCTVKARRLDFSDFRKRSGGIKYPHFYSAALHADLLPVDDLMNLQTHRLLWYVERDSTEASRTLLKALDANRLPNDIPAWRQVSNNVTASYEHRVDLLGRETTRVLSWEGPVSDKARRMLQHLQDAEGNAQYIETRIADPLTEDLQHLGAWRAALEDLICEFGLHS